MTVQTNLEILPDKSEFSSANEASLYVALADAITTEIQNGNIPDAVALNESMLAHLFNVSRTPARQALLSLAENGLLSALPTRGFVTGPNLTLATKRLADFPNSVDALRAALNTSTPQSPLYEDLEKKVARLAAHGAWRFSIRAAQEYYDVGRGAMEDALRKLEANGLLTRRPGGQWIALKMDSDRLEALFDVRSWLEPKLLEGATIRIPMEVLDDAISSHQSALERLPNVSGAELDALETILHHDLMEYAGNAPGLAALRTVKAGIVFSKHVLASDEVPVGDDDPFIEEHLAVLGALKRRRSEECKLRLLAHLLKSREKCANRLQLYKDNARDTDCVFAKRIDE